MNMDTISDVTDELDAITEEQIWQLYCLACRVSSYPFQKRPGLTELKNTAQDIILDIKRNTKNESGQVDLSLIILSWLGVAGAMALVYAMWRYAETALELALKL